MTTVTYNQVEAWFKCERDSQFRIAQEHRPRSSAVREPEATKPSIPWQVLSGQAKYFSRHNTKRVSHRAHMPVFGRKPRRFHGGIGSDKRLGIFTGFAEVSCCARIGREPTDYNARCNFKSNVSQQANGLRDKVFLRMAHGNIQMPTSHGSQR